MHKKSMHVLTLALLANVSFPVASMADPENNLVLTNGSVIGGFSPLVGAIGNGQGADVTNYATGEIYMYGDKSPAIYVRMHDSYNQNGPTGTISVVNDGLLDTGEDVDPSRTMQHGMALGFTVGDDNAKRTAGDVHVVNNGHIVTRNPSSRGIYIERYEFAAGIVSVDNSRGDIKILNTVEVDKMLTGDGIHIQGGKADLDINLGDIEIMGMGAGAALITDGDVAVKLEQGNTVITHDSISDAVNARSAEGNVNLDIAGKIYTEGKGSNGINVSAAPEMFPFGSNEVEANVLKTGFIESRGDNANGVIISSAGTTKLAVDGAVTAFGQNSNGITSGSIGGATTVTIGSSGKIEGGRGQGSALVLGSVNDGVEVTNHGQLSALSDRLISDLDEMGPVGNFKVTNNGLMTGFVKLGSAGSNYFENTSKFISRNFSANNPDGVRDLRGVAINDMGGDNSHVVNTAGGVLSLGESSAEDFDVTGYYKARTGINNRLFSQDIYDFERKGLLQTQFTNTASFKNEGLIDLTGEQVGNTLVITSSSDAEIIGSGTYVSGGTLKLGAELNDGDGGQGSKADMLIADRVEKGASATTIEVAVKSEANAALTKQNGIQLVQVRDKDHSAEGAFALGGNNAYQHNGATAIGQGAYAYKLYQNGLGDDKADGNWYLRSQVKDDEPGEDLYTGGVPLYEAYPQFLLGLNSLPTLQQRVGNHYWNNAGNKLLAQGADVVEAYTPAEENGVHIEENAIWGRIEGAHTKIRSRETTSGTDYDYNTFKMQAGLDGLLHESEDGKLIGGITAHYTNGKAEVYSKHGKGDIKTDGYGLGATLTWYGENGFYVDNQAQLTWYDSDLNSSTAKKSMVKGNDGFGYTLSVETGKRSELNENWSLTPQAQLQYSNVDFDSFVDPFKGHVSRKRGESLEGRLGLSLEHQDSWFNDEGRINRSYVYGIANLYSEFLNGTKVRVDDKNFINKRERVWASLGLGGSYNWNDDKYSVYGEGSVYTSLNHFGDSYSYKGTVGLRVKW